MNPGFFLSSEIHMEFRFLFFFVIIFGVMKPSVIQLGFEPDSQQGFHSICNHVAGKFHYASLYNTPNPPS